MTNDPRATSRPDEWMGDLHIETFRTLLLRKALKKFGKPTPEQEAAFRGIATYNRLFGLALFDFSVAQNWEEFLAPCRPVNAATA